MIKTIHVGYDYKHSMQYVSHIDSKHDTWLIVNTFTPVQISINGKWDVYHEPQVIIYPPMSDINYKAHNGPLQNHWISFQTDESFITNALLPSETPIEITTQSYFEYIFQMLAIENFDYNTYKDESTKLLFRLLYNKLEEEYGHHECYSHERALNILNANIVGNPEYDWNVQYMADHVGLSIAHFQNIYKNIFNTTCMEFVFQQRVKLATEYLLNTDYSIKYISTTCGYNNVEHFSRQFKKVTSYSPSKYRSLYKNDNS